MGIEIDNQKDYINVSTMYPITERKINNRLYRGKIKNVYKYRILKCLLYNISKLRLNSQILLIIIYLVRRKL